MKKSKIGIWASAANGLFSETDSMNLATPQILMNRHTTNTMNRQTLNTKGLLGATSSMMVAFILLVAGFGFASVAQAQLSAFGPPVLFGANAENCSPTNNAVDPGESVTMRFTVTNNTATAAVNVLVTLQTGGTSHVVASPAPTPSFQIIAGGVGAHATATVDFTFTASGLCGVDQVTATLLIASPYNGSVTFPPVQLGATVTTPNTFSNTGVITIPGSGSNGPSAPNPSKITRPFARIFTYVC